MGKLPAWEIIGIALLVAVGVARPVLYLARFDSSAVWGNSFLQAASPLPIVFNRKVFFSSTSLLIRDDTGERPVTFDAIISPLTFSARGSAQVHVGLRSAGELRSFSERENKLAQKLFCSPSLYPFPTKNIRGVSILVRYPEKWHTPPVRTDLLCS